MMIHERILGHQVFGSVYTTTPFSMSVFLTVLQLKSAAPTRSVCVRWSMATSPPWYSLHLVAWGRQPLPLTNILPACLASRVSLILWLWAGSIAIWGSPCSAHQSCASEAVGLNLVGILVCPQTVDSWGHLSVHWFPDNSFIKMVRMSLARIHLTVSPIPIGQTPGSYQVQ